jgi:hypothetical protein
LLSHENITHAPSARFFCALYDARAKVSLGPIFRSALSAVSSADPAPRSLGLQFVPQAEADAPRRYLVIVPASTTEPVRPAQVEAN